MFARGGRRGIGEGTPSGARDDVLLRSSGRGAEDRRGVSVGVGCVRVSSKTSFVFRWRGSRHSCEKRDLWFQARNRVIVLALLGGGSTPRQVFHFSLDAYDV